MHLKTDTSRESHFSRVPTISHSRNSFSIAEKHLTTIQFDYLYPIYWKYMYPGDTISITEAMMARLTTQNGTLYDDLYIDVHAWYTPFRLLQTNWSRFQFNDQPTGPTQDNSALTTPKITLSGLGAGGFAAKTLYDYLGFPTEVNLSADVEHINNYIGRAYNHIHNLNYRDQNLQTQVTVDFDDGPDNPADYVLLKRGKRHDKFTSCLTAQQKGTASTITLGTTAPVNLSATTGVTQQVRLVSNHALVSSAVAIQSSAAGILEAGGAGEDLVIDPHGTLYSDVSGLSITVNQLRSSIAIQHLLEADARGGTRDVEAIQHRWGVTVPDFRLNRPEYLGGQTFTFDGHIVPQTSETGTTPQGTLTQFSQATSRFNVTHSFQEHGVFMILISCRSNLTYQQGLLRELSYRTRYDFFQPEFANLGEVAVKNKEIFMSSNDTDNNATFGFQEYGYELRYSENRVTGEMRSNFATSRDNLHMATDFASLPTLGSAFIVSSTDISRNITVAAGTADPIELSTFVTGSIARTLPMYSVPGLLRL